MAHFQSNQPRKGIAEASAGQGRSHPGRVPESCGTAFCTRPGNGIACGEYWSTPIGDDRSNLVRSGRQNDGGPCSAFLCAQPVRKNKDRSFLPPCAAPSDRPQRTPELEGGVALLHGNGLPFSFNST